MSNPLLYSLTYISIISPRSKIVDQTQVTNLRLL